MTDTGTNRPDRALVAAHLDGDPSALAAMYDRFGASLHDTARAMLSDAHEAEDLTHDVFVIAAERLDQLRDPDRLRAWLFAILRNEVYRRTRRRHRVAPTDPHTAAVADMAAPDDPHAEGADVELAEAAAFVRAAAAGLGTRDQLVLELSARQGLAGADLADALGVTQPQCHVMVNRMRDRVKRSIGALTVARHGRRDCADLQQLLRQWNGTFDEKIRKRIAGHIDGCETCERTSKRLAVVPLIAAAPAFAAPVTLRDRVVGITSDPAGSATGDRDVRFDGVDGFPRQARAGRRVVALIGVATVALLVIGGGWLAVAEGGEESGAPEPLATTGSTEPSPSSTAALAVPTSSTPAPTSAAPTTAADTTVPDTTELPPDTTTPALDPPPPPPTPPTAPPAPGQLVLSSSAVDLGAAVPSATVSLANTGERSLDWTISGERGAFILSSLGGTLVPGGSENVGIAVDRASLPEGALFANITVTSSAQGTATLALAASVERPPTVSLLSSPMTLLCPGLAGSPVLVSVTDESAISGVQLQWSGPGTSGSTPMFSVGPNWEGILSPDAVNGAWTLEVVASDARGNTGRASAPFSVSGC
ncbi:MAG: sigma-70 family RNA polymerase sigma factor [Ilumatobacteraceae bacterium]